MRQFAKYTLAFSFGVITSSFCVLKGADIDRKKYIAAVEAWKNQAS